MWMVYWILLHNGQYKATDSVVVTNMNNEGEFGSSTASTVKAEIKVDQSLGSSSEYIYVASSLAA